MDGEIAGLDARRMRRALELAAEGRCGASPNPMVGAVIADADGTIVGEGYHAAFGSDHAEVNALREAGERARGGTMWVTLEPCNHHGKTPPCTDALLEAGLRRVVAAQKDPSSSASGGIERLRAAGVEVEVGVEAGAATSLNRRWLCSVQRQRSWVTLKSAVSLDGRIATHTGHSQWITSETARRRSLELREEHDAILVGSGTLIADNPRLTRRLGLNPVDRWRRLVLDSRLRAPLTSRIITEQPELTTIVHVAGADTSRQGQLIDHGVHLLEVEADAQGRVALEPLIRQLAAEGVAALLVEGGASIAGSFADQGLVDEVFLFVAPMIIGGPAPSAVAGHGITRLESARRLSFECVHRQGSDLELHAVAEEHACSPA